MSEETTNKPPLPKAIYQELIYRMWDEYKDKPDKFNMGAFVSRYVQDGREDYHFCNSAACVSGSLGFLLKEKNLIKELPYDWDGFSRDNFGVFYNKLVYSAGWPYPITCLYHDWDFINSPERVLGGLLAVRWYFHKFYGLKLSLPKDAYVYRINYPEAFEAAGYK